MPEPEPEAEPAPDVGEGPLADVLVADFSRVLAGPVASMFLADLGATVVKVERPDGGDDTRAWGPPFVGPMTTYFASVNRNKRSLVLDLRDPADLRLASTLATRADILLENFKPGTMATFGLDPATLQVEHNGLVYCSISGFGSGRGADLPGYDFVAQAVGGLMSITGRVDDPTKVGVALVDVLTGLHATIGILAALRERDVSGRGQVVEVNLLSSLIASLANQGTGYINGNQLPAAMGNAHPSIAPYETLATAEGLLAIAVGNDRQFARLAEAVGMPWLSSDARFSTNTTRVAHRRALITELERPLSTATAREWATRLTAIDIACGPVNDIEEALDLATRLDLHPIVTFQNRANGEVSTLSNPLRLSRTPVQYYRPPPDLGADTEDVREWLSRDALTTRDLHERGSSEVRHPESDQGQA